MEGLNIWLVPYFDFIWFQGTDTRRLEHRSVCWYGAYLALGRPLLRSTDDVWQLCTLQLAGRYPGRGLLQPGEPQKQTPTIVVHLGIKPNETKSNQMKKTVAAVFVRTTYICTLCVKRLVLARLDTKRTKTRWQIYQGHLNLS